jgi:hypothetical protein
MDEEDFKRQLRKTRKKWKRWYSRWQ